MPGTELGALRVHNASGYGVMCILPVLCAAI
jgi:hypothetical protein